MRPTVNQVLSGIRRIIQDVLLPDLASDYTKTPAMEIVGALTQLEKRWEKVIPNLMEENDDLRFLFSSVLPVLREIEQRQPSATLRSLTQDIENQLGEALSAPTKYPSYPVLEKENDDLHALLVKTIEALEALKDSYPDARLEELRQRIRIHLRKYLNRELELLPAVRLWVRP